MSTNAPMSGDSAIPVDTTTSTDATISADPDVAGSTLNSDAFSPLRIRPFPKATTRQRKEKETLRNHQF